MVQIIDDFVFKLLDSILKVSNLQTKKMRENVFLYEIP